MKLNRFFSIVITVIITSVVFAKEDLAMNPAGEFLPSDFSKSDSSSVDSASDTKSIISVLQETEKPEGGISQTQSKSQSWPSESTGSNSNYSANQYWYREYTSEGTNLPILSIQQTEQGDLVVSGSGNGPWFGLLTATGETDNTWQKKFGNAGSAPTFLPLKSGGFMALIYYGSQAGIVKLNSLGQVEWQYRYEGPSDEYPASMIETSDGDIVVVGRAKFLYGDLPKYWIFKVDSKTGIVIWNSVLGVGGSSYGATSVTELKNGELIVAGYISAAHSPGLLVKLGPDGEVVWKKQFTDLDGGTSEVPEFILEVDDGLLVAGKSSGNVWITKMDPNGEVIWPQSISYVNSEYNHTTAFMHAGDGNVLLLTRSVSPSYTGRLFKIDASSGSLIWERKFDGYAAQSMDIATDGSILIAGNRYYGPGGIFRLDSEGNLPYCDAIGLGDSISTSGAIYSTISFDGDVTQPAIDVIESHVVVDDLPVNTTEICQFYAIPSPFLDLPFEYPYHHSLALQNRTSPTYGRINSWFDHDFPTPYRYEGINGNLILYSGYDVLPFGWWYDNHDGYDFRYVDPLPENADKYDDLPILAAGSGTVVLSNFGDYGEQIRIYHGNGYFTFYGHLKSGSRLVKSGDYVLQGQQIGIMGDTGPQSEGVHLHFGVYRDNGNEIWDGPSVDKQVDPNGWKGSYPDPWVSERAGPASYWLWEFDSSQQETINGDEGGVLWDPSGLIKTVFPPGLFNGAATLELFFEPVVSQPTPSHKSTGFSFQLRSVDNLPNLQTSSANDNIAVSRLSFSQPITLTVNYLDTSMSHADENLVKLFHWDDLLESWKPLTTTVETANNFITAGSTDLGHFDLQAPLLCPDDPFIYDDDFYGAEPIDTDGSLMSRLFDVEEDEDWFSFEARRGASYLIQTQDLTGGADTGIEVYDVDGVTLLADDDSNGEGAASSLTWQAPGDGTYFVRIIQSAGSKFGCAVSYSISIEQNGYRIYLPGVLR